MVKQEPDMESARTELVEWIPRPFSSELDSPISPAPSSSLTIVQPKEEERSNSAGAADKISERMDRNAKPSEPLRSEENSMQLCLVPSPTCENASGGRDFWKKDRISVGRDRRVMKSRHFENPKRILPSVGAFTVQCAQCYKWRFIPSKEQYEEIRQSITEKPFVCEAASSWRPDASCNDPADLSQDVNLLWAIDKPNIPRAPPGWERLLAIRGAGSTKFADIYYIDPLGRKLRSMPEVERFLAEHPEYGNAGVKLSQFSFMSPRPLDQGYIRKRPAGVSSTGSSNKAAKKRNANNSTEIKRYISSYRSTTQEAVKLLTSSNPRAESLGNSQFQRVGESQPHNSVLRVQTLQGTQHSHHLTQVARPCDAYNYALSPRERTCHGSQKANESCFEISHLTFQVPQASRCFSPMPSLQVSKGSGIKAVDFIDLEKPCLDLEILPSTSGESQKVFHVAQQAPVVELLKDHDYGQTHADTDSGTPTALSLVPDTACSIQWTAARTTALCHLPGQNTNTMSTHVNGPILSYNDSTVSRVLTGQE